jgi:hypothetical protein
MLINIYLYLVFAHALLEGEAFSVARLQEELGLMVL